MLMTVVGDEIILNCRECFVRDGFGIHLKKDGNSFVCPHNRTHRYIVEDGFLKKI